MKKKNTSTYVLISLLIVQGAICTLLVLNCLSNMYNDKWRNYGENEQKTHKLYIKDISNDKQEQIRSLLLEEVDREHAFIFKKVSLNQGESIRGMKMGVYGYVNSMPEFDFLGRDIVNKKSVEKLLKSEKDENTLGVLNGSANSIGNIPLFNFGDNFVIEKLKQTTKETVNGQYYISGLDTAKFDSLVNDLAKATKQNRDNFLISNRQESVTAPLRDMFIIGFVIGSVILNAVANMILYLLRMKDEGKYILMGWSRKSFFAMCYQEIINAAFILIPIVAIALFVFSGWNNSSISFISYCILAGLINVILMFIELIPVALTCFSVKPINAIHGRVPKKMLYISMSVVYLIVVGMLQGSCWYVDGLKKSIDENSKLLSRWEKVSDYNVLYDILPGDDQESFANNSNKLSMDVLDWYKSMEDKKGVYIINTSEYSSSVIQGWKDYKSYKNIPDKPFWYFYYSPNYAKKEIPDLDSKLLDEARNGVRVYLLPDTLSKKEKIKVEKWIKEDTESNMSDDDIKTSFESNKEYKFVYYKPGKKFFTWSTKSKEKIETDSPYILLTTSENINSVECDNLRAETLENTMIKFENTKLADKYTDIKYLKKYHLDDNKIKFIAVREYINGIQKSLRTSICWFGVVIGILSVIVTGNLLAIAVLYKKTNIKKNSIKKFLGYSNLQMHGKISTVVIVAVIIEILIAKLLQCRIGMLMTTLLGIVQLVVLKVYLSKNAVESIITEFKEN